MSSLTNKEKVLIADVLEIKNGYIFDRLRQIIDYNKTNTRNIIWGACGIDIFVEQPYVDLSQQKCIEYIWDHEEDNVTYHVLHDLMDFYFRNYPKNKLSETMKAQFNRCLEILRRLQKTQELPLPSGKTEQLKVLQKDITDSLAEGNPELCIDRLHTFATEYIRHVCDTHGVSVLDDKGEHLPLHSIMGALSKFYRDTNIHFTLKQHPMTDADLADFIACYNPENRHERTETWSPDNPDGRWRKFSVDEILARDKTSMDIFWVKDKSLADLDSLPDPDMLAMDIIENLQSALESFQELRNQLAE